MNDSLPENLAPAKMCFACGPDNDIGLKIKFTVEGDECTGEFTATEQHVGYENTVHGGIIFTCLDDVMANIMYQQGRKAFTAKCDVRYRQALEVGQTIVLKGWIESERRRLVQLKGEARLKSDDAVIASCDASFMLS